MLVSKIYNRTCTLDSVCSAVGNSGKTGKNQDPFIIVSYQILSLHCTFIPNQLYKYHLCSLLMFTCFLISTLQSCTPAAAPLSPHCTLPFKSPQHTLLRNNFVTSSLYILLFQRMQEKINSLKIHYSWEAITIPFLLLLCTFSHKVKNSHAQCQYCRWLC